jgi:hypothetical protein
MRRGDNTTFFYLYGKDQFPTLNEEHSLRVFDNKVLKRIFGTLRDDVTGGLRKLRYEELHNLYSSSDTVMMIKSRRMRWAGHIARVGEMRNAYKFLTVKPEGKRQLGRPRRRGR